MIPRYASFVFFVLFLFSLLIAFYTGVIDDNIQKVIFPAFSPYQLPALIIGNIPSLGRASADIIPPPPPILPGELAFSCDSSYLGLGEARTVGWLELERRIPPDRRNSVAALLPPRYRGWFTRGG